MIPRLAEARISDLLTRFPAVAVLGPRQVRQGNLGDGVEAVSLPGALAALRGRH